MKRSFLLCFCLLLLFACENKRSPYFNQYLSAYTGLINKKLIFPPNLLQVKGEKIQPGTKQIITVVGADCGSCIELFEAWRKYLAETPIKGASVSFIALGRNNPLLDGYLKSNDPPFNIYIDTTSSFLQTNDIDAYFKKTMMIDEQGKVVMAGDPIGNNQVRDYYDFLIHD